MTQRIPKSPSRPRAFTLVEMVVSMVILAIVLMAAESAVLLSGKAIPNGKSAISGAMNAARAQDLLSSDLMYALTVTEQTANAITFTVPDRNSDGSNETIRYAWTGTVGDPLTRQYNGGVVANLVDKCYEFTLLYDKRQAAAAQTFSEGSEFTLASYDTSASPLTGVVNATAFFGQTFTPTLPSGATSFRVSRVKFYAKYDGTTTGTATVGIRTASSGAATSTVLDSVSLAESTLPSTFQWQTFNFTNATGILPGQQLAITVTTADAKGNACDVQYSFTAGSSGLTKSTGGASAWTAQSGLGMMFYAYGYAMTPNAATYQYYLTNVRTTLRTSSDSNSRLTTWVRTPNEPSVTGP